MWRWKKSSPKNRAQKNRAKFNSKIAIEKLNESKELIEKAYGQKLPSITSTISGTYSNSEKQTFDKQDIKFCIECGTENPNSNNFCNNCGSILSTKESNTIRTDSQSFRKEGKKNTFAEYEREYLNRVTGETDNSSEKDTSLEEKFVKQIEHGIPKTKKSSSSGKIAGIIGIIAIIVIGGGAAALTLDFDISNNTTVLERATCDSKTILSSTTKIPGFPDPEKDLHHYLDRYSNEPNYADWFDRNFPGMTIEEIVC